MGFRRQGNKRCCALPQGLTLDVGIEPGIPLAEFFGGDLVLIAVEHSIEFLDYGFWLAQAGGFCGAESHDCVGNHTLLESEGKLENRFAGEEHLGRLAMPGVEDSEVAFLANQRNIQPPLGEAERVAFEFAQRGTASIQVDQCRHPAFLQMR